MGRSNKIIHFNYLAHHLAQSKGSINESYQKREVYNSTIATKVPQQKDQFYLTLSQQHVVHDWCFYTFLYGK